MTHYKSNLESFKLTRQTQGVHLSQHKNGTTTEIYPDTGNNGTKDGVKIYIVTTTTEAKDFLKIETESIYTIDDYKFQTPIKSTDNIAIGILTKLAKHSLKLHAEQYKSLTKSNVFDGTFIPDKTEKQIFDDLVELYKIKEIKPGQNN